MIFSRFRQRRTVKHLRARVESCVEIILALNDYLGEGKLKTESMDQFERLKESLCRVGDDSFDEIEIHRIEEATNELLREIKLPKGRGPMIFARGDAVH